MGVELLEVGVKVRKGVIFTIKGCFRSVCSHPFLVGVLCFLIFLYRLSPFVFQLLVSASPIIVCTAVLLGTLLSFGQPNIPEIEIEEKTTFEAVSVKAGVLGETAVVEKQNESNYVERFSEKRWDEAEHSTEQPGLSAGKIGEVWSEHSDAPLIEERSPEIEVDDGEIWERNKEIADIKHKQKTEWIEDNNGEVMKNHYASVANVNDKLLESDDEKSEADSFDSERVNVDSLDSPPRSPWTRVEEREDDVEEDDEDEEDTSDSGSGQAESSSPDASMADIIPMLDELHPLLDEEAPHAFHMSHGGSDAASEKSPKSNTSSHESDHEDLEVADDDNEDGEDEEDAQGDKEVQIKSAIMWTEEDQKNLMDLGSSEIERNQRLENLILRRRARKMFAERNLIDLENSDLPFTLTPISTRRQNPFDLPHDYYDNSGLPPIPGSAPSVLLARRNPFDIPYDSSEEKPDLMGDGFQEEFTTSQSRELFFRRHESFNVGPSSFAHRRQNIKKRHYFVREGTISEESSSSLFQRQSSELSASKMSSVPDAESISSVISVEGPEERRLSEEDNFPEVEVIALMKEVTEEGPSGEPELIHQQEVEIQEDINQEPEMISKLDSVSEHVRNGIQSSEEEDCLELGQIEKRDVEVGELESQVEEVADHYEEGSVTQFVEAQGTGSHSNYGAVELRYTRDSSSSSLSEASERVFSETEEEGLSMLEERRVGVAEEPCNSIHTSVESAEVNIRSTLVNDVPHREPVYDTSPRELSKNLSSSSISFDVYPASDLGFPRILDKRTVTSIERGSEGISQEIEIDIPRNIDKLPDSSIAHPVDGLDIRESDSIRTDISGVDQRYVGEGSSGATGIAPHVSIPLKSSDEASMEEHLTKKHICDEAPVSAADNKIDTLVRSSEDQNLEQLQENDHLVLSRDGPLEINEPPFEGQLRAELSIWVEETVKSPNSVADVHEADVKLISTPSAEGNTSVFFDKAIYEPHYWNLDEVQVHASSTPGESFVDGQATQKLNMPEVQELDSYISSNINFPSPEFFPVPPNGIETTSLVDVQTVVEEVDEIKEIDDGLLCELDNVGDFSIKQLGLGSSESEKHIYSAGEKFSPHHVETSSVRFVNSIDMNKIEYAFHSENSKENIDIFEEDVKCISELQTPETSRAENCKASRKASNVSYGQDSPYQESSGYKSLSKENEVQPGYSLGNHNSEYTVSRIPDLELPTAQDCAVFRKAESVESEVMMGGAEIFSPAQLDNTTSGMSELEASTIEDIDMAFKEISSKEIEKTVLEPSQAAFHNSIFESEVQSLEEVDVSENAELTFVRTEIVVGDTEASSQGQVDVDTILGMPELEANTIKNIDLAVKQIISREIEKAVISELPQDGLHNNEDIISGMPEHEEKSIEHVDTVLEKAELTSLETDTTVGCDDIDISCQDQVNTATTSRMTELEASTMEDIDLAFKQIISKEMEKPIVLEPPQGDSYNYENTVSGIPELEALPIEDVDTVLEKAEFTYASTEIMLGSGDVSSLAQVDTDTTSGMTELEASTIDDIDLVFKQISSKEIMKPFVLEPLQAELVVGETITENSDDGASHRVSEVEPNKDAALDDTQLIDYITETHGLHDSVDRTLHGETKETSSELHAAEPMTSENSLLPINQVLGGETHKQLKLKSGDGSVQVKGDKTGPSEAESSVKESSAFAAEKPEHEVKAPKHLHSPSSVKGKGKISKTSSSSSSSSSESSSSDSDKE